MSDNRLFDIDEFDLVNEWKKQPKFFLHYAEQLADARRDFEQVKAEREIVRAETDREIRKDPKKFGLEKITETVIENTITLNVTYQRINSKWLETKGKVDTLQAIVDGLDHRKRALEKIVDLFLSGYYAECKTPKGNNKEVYEDIQKKDIRGKAKLGLNRKED